MDKRRSLLDKRRSLLDVETWTRLVRYIVAPFAFALLITYDPRFAGLIVLGIAAAGIHRLRL